MHRELPERDPMRVPARAERVAPSSASRATSDQVRDARAYYPSIDGMRAIAVLSVLAYHVSPSALKGGFVGVDIFFAISGFVVAASVSKLPAATGFRALMAHFYARRMTRIAPALVVCILVTVVLSTMFVPYAWLSGANDRSGLAALFGASNVVLAAFAGDYFSPRSEFNPYTHTWSLAVEEQFYLVFPWLFFWWLRASNELARRRVVAAVALLSISSLTCSAVWSIQQPVRAFYLLPARFWEIGVGVLLFLTMSRWRPRLLALRTGAAGALCWCGLAGLAVSCVAADPDRFPFPWALLPVLSSALIIAVIVARGELLPARILAYRPIALIGIISYSLYLWHWPVLVLLRWTSGVEGVTARFFAIGASMCLAWASYRWVEVPVREARSVRMAARGRVVLVGVVGLVVASGVSLAVFRSRAAVSLSKTRDAKIWFPDTIARNGGPAPKCAVERSVEHLGSGDVTHFNPARCQQSGSGKRVFVAGDSHAAAYAGMLRVVAEQSGADVFVLQRGGCSLFDLRFVNAHSGPSCGEFARDAVAYVRSNARAGDVLFLPSLRLPRFVDQWGEIRKGALVSDEDRAAAAGEAVSALAPLAAQGVHIVFEAPTPVFRVPLFRCADWFNRMNPVCDGGTNVDRLLLQRLREPVLASIHRIAGAVADVTIWDPFPLVCPPGPVCSPYADELPLFFDMDHLSGYGNEFLLKDFLAVLDPMLAGGAAPRGAR